MMTYVSELRYDDAVNSTNILHNISLSCNILNKAKVIIHNLYVLVVLGISALTLEFDLSGQFGLSIASSRFDALYTGMHYRQ